MSDPARVVGNNPPRGEVLVVLLGQTPAAAQATRIPSSTMNFYPAPPTLQAEVYLRIPDSLRCTGQPTEWRGGFAGPASDIFLEGPICTPDGALYLVDIPYGRILRLGAEKQVTECVRYDGEPNGLALLPDGCFAVADYKQVRLCKPPCPILVCRHSNAMGM